MMEEELRQLLKEHGWTLSIRRRGSRKYAYAQRIKKDETYLKPLERLSELTPEEVLKKIS